MRTLAFLALAACSTGQVELDADASTDTDADGSRDTADPYPECSEDDLGELYERYVEPVMSDAHPQSCNQCHLAGVDLTMFVGDTPCESMACLIEMGWVDLEDPEASEVLAFIEQGEADSDMITEETLAAEHEGFLQWISWSAECHEPVCGEIDDPCGLGESDNELPEGTETPLGGCEEDELVEAFTAKVWSWHGRCWSCHHADGESREDFDSAPPFYVWDGDNHNSSRASMYNLIGMGAVDVVEPHQSTLITKPLQEGATVDTDIGEITGVWHGGTDKFKLTETDAGGVMEDEAFWDFVDWLELYAECR